MQIPFDLAESLADLGLGRYQSIVLTEIQKQVYGPFKASVAEISQAEISRRYNIHRQNVSRAVASLLAMKIIVQHPNGYGMNLVTSEWTRNGESLKDHATQVVNTTDNPSVDVIKSDDKVVIKSDYTYSEVVIKSDDKTSDQQSQCNQNRLQTSSDLMTNVIKFDDTSSIREEKTAAVGEVESKEVASSLPPWKYQEVADWLETVTANPVVKEGLETLANGLPADWVKGSLRRSYIKYPNDPNRWLSYADGILRRWQIQGGPDKDVLPDLRSKPAGPRAGELPEFKRPEWMNTGGTLPPPRPNRLPSPGGSVKHG